VNLYACQKANEDTAQDAQERAHDSLAGVADTKCHD
jgi:hypothetical protein